MSRSTPAPCHPRRSRSQAPAPDSYAASGRFWPTAQELLRDDAEAVQALPIEQRYALFFDRFIDALRARPLTIEILAAEIVERNELTSILETEREQWGEQVEKLFGREAFSSRPELRGVTLMLVAGVQHLLVRRNVSMTLRHPGTLI